MERLAEWFDTALPLSLPLNRKADLMLTAKAWTKMRDEAKAEIAAMTVHERVYRADQTDVLVDGGRISPHELSRVDAFCDLLAQSMQVGDDGKPRFTGRTQELVQILLRNA